MEEGGKLFQKFMLESKQRKRKRQQTFYHKDLLDDFNIKNDDCDVENDMLTLGLSDFIRCCLNVEAKLRIMTGKLYLSTLYF